MATMSNPWPHCASLFLLLLLSSQWCGVEASERVFLYPQASTVSSIVSKQYRTAYHFQPPKNWINDPNGPMYYNGIYHLFYQYNPNGSLWGNIVWGHSVSTDLINWFRLEPAINRTTPNDINGCWSGSATVLAGDQLVILYTGANTEKHQVQNIAFPANRSDPYLRNWTKADNNPLIQPVGLGLDPGQFRDPTTGWVGPDGLYRIAVGAELYGNGAAILFKSTDFLNWTRLDHPLHSSNASKVWECPDFYAVLSGNNSGLDTTATMPDGAKHVLKMSLTETRHDYYMIGVYDRKRDAFVPDDVLDDVRLWAKIDHGNYYASKSFFDAKKGRRVLCGWTNESDSSADDVAKGWAGIHAIPRRIWLDGNGKQLLQWPVEEIELLRRNEIDLKDIELKKGDLFEIKGIDTLQADVEVDFEVSGLEGAEPMDPSWLLDPEKLCREADATVPGAAGPFGLLLLASGGLTEHTAVFFRLYSSQQKTHTVLMCSDLRRSSLREGLYTPAYGGFFEIDLRKEKKISLRTLIDRSAIESFGSGGRACMTARVYPIALIDEATHLYAFNNGSTAVKVSQLKAWSMDRASVNAN